MGGLSAVQLNKKCGYIDSTGKMVIPAIYDKALIYRDGWAFVSLGCPEATMAYVKTFRSNN
jgi:hypothetical protein